MITDTAVRATERANDRAHEILCDAEQLHDVLLDNLPQVADALAGCFRELGRSHINSYIVAGALKHLENQLHAAIVDEIYEAIEVAEYEEQQCK